MSTRCITPFYRKEDSLTPLPCGKCPPCVQRRTSGWSFRLSKEGERSCSSLFVTLTYDTQYVPIVGTQKTLDKEDIQLFFKRLRKRHDRKKRLYKKLNIPHEPIKYYCAGEYGTKRWRPHYHIILFNAEHQDVIDAWVHPKEKKAIGEVHFGTVEEASIQYSLKYISKPKRIPHWPGDKRQPEFALMSKNLGTNYLTERMIRWHISDLENRNLIMLPGGKKAPLPRYYREKIYNSEQWGFLKGVLEKAGKFREQIARLNNDNYEWDKVESDKAQFRKMYKNSNVGHL